jgi:S1-C subfamily serine protease
MSALLDERAPTNDEADALDAYSRIVTTVADALLPSVVSLRVMRAVRGGRLPSGSGSAVVLSGDGLLITSAHVVAAAHGVPGTAVFHDGQEHGFEVVGVDKLSDLAVVRASGTDLPAATIGDAATLRVGQLVVAVGSPLGFAGSVSAGVVSALGRSITTGDGQHARIVEDVIQTDAALHPGNSGGALATSAGVVVGINTAVVGPGIGQGLGLAVPLNATTMRIVQSLISDGRVRRAYLGLAGGTRALPPRVATQLGRERGLEVTSVVDASPAHTAAIKPEDLIVAVEGQPVAGIGDLQRLLTGERIGIATALTVVRAGETRDIEVVPVEL